MLADFILHNGVPTPEEEREAATGYKLEKLGLANPTQVSDTVAVVAPVLDTLSVPKVKVALSRKDWADLVNFVGGDLANMYDDQDENGIKAQMTRICNTIRRKLV